MDKDKFINTIAEYCMKLSLCEIAIGGILHGLHIPFTGQVMSLNQTFFLIVMLRNLPASELKNKAPLYVSNISALLKALSPAGKKLGPMISISMQGFLFWLPNYILPINQFSINLGAILSSFWAFIQPIITLYIFFGHNLINAIKYHLEKIQSIFPESSQYFYFIILFPIVLKAIIAFIVSTIAWRINTNKSHQYIQFLLGKISNYKPQPKKERGLIKDLTRPFFLLSLALTFSYLFFNRQHLAPTFWSYLRPIAIVFLIFIMGRINLIEKLLGPRQEHPFFQILSKVNRRIESFFTT